MYTLLAFTGLNSTERKLGVETQLRKNIEQAKDKQLTIVKARNRDIIVLYENLSTFQYI